MPEEMTDTQKLEALQKEKADLEAKLVAEQAEKVKLQERYDNADKKIKEQGSELGDLRKSKEKLEELERTKAELEGKITALEGKTGQEKKEDKVAEPLTVEQIEEKLGADAKKKVEEAFETMAPEQRVKFHEDKKFRKTVLERASELAPTIPDSPWKTPKKDGDESGGTKSLLDKLFNTKKEQGAFTPDGSAGGGGHRMGGVVAPQNDDKPYTEDDRVS